MDPVLIGGAALVACSLPVGWFAVASAKGNGREASRHLKSKTAVDLHELLLTRSAEERVVGPVVQTLARRVRRLTPKGFMSSLERRVGLAGLPASWPIERVLAAKLILGFVSVVLALLVLSGGTTRTNLGLAGVVLIVGYQFPDLMLTRRADARQGEIQRTLADAIDQVTISVEAGLGFDAALSRYAETGTGPLAEEFAHLLQDVQLGTGRRAAFEAMLQRTDVDDLRRFVAALRQAGEHGIPLAKVLRTQAEELREQRRQRAEAKAAAIPVKVIFPMIVCILPTLFIVVLGPAVFRIADTF
ncbi:MAG: type II secretion system F family protein [Actinomycetota bacterium]|nr:type II secretion system F family protein [Actinomycetota bacterium]